MPRTDVRYGDGVVRAAPDVVAELGGRRVLLVCGRGSFEASGAAAMLPALAGVAQVRRWSDFAPNPELAELERGLAVVAGFRPDVVLGVGGGTALDLAKLLVAFAPAAAGEVADAVRAGRPPPADHAGRPVPADGSRPGLVLAPTTSGSGSEATHFAVVYIGSQKFSVAGESMRADVVLLDPALARSGSAYQRASSGIDAVAQAVESLWAVAATPGSRRWARQALRLLLPAVEPFVHRADPAAARAMAIGAHLAGRAIDTSRTTAAHALSYGITTRYGVSHGHAVGLTLGGFLAVHSEAAPERLRAGVDPAGHAAVLAEIRARLGAADGAAARQRWRALLRRVGLQPGLAAVGVDRAGCAELAAAVNVERLGNNPVAFTTGELAALLEQLG